MDGINGLVSIKSIFVFNNNFLFLFITNYNIPLEFKNLENFILLFQFYYYFFYHGIFPIAKIFMGDS